MSPHAFSPDTTSSSIDCCNQPSVFTYFDEYFPSFAPVGNSGEPESFAVMKTLSPSETHLFHPSKRAGRNKVARIKAKTASKVMPMSRKGKDSTQTIGSRTSASSANGQQSANKMHQPMNRIRIFILSLRQPSRAESDLCSADVREERSIRSYSKHFANAKCFNLLYSRQLTLALLHSEDCRRGQRGRCATASDQSHGWSN